MVLTWSRNWGLFSVLPQHPVLSLATLCCCKLTVICLFHPPDGSDWGLGIALCSLFYSSMENSAGHWRGIKGRKAGIA